MAIERALAPGRRWLRSIKPDRRYVKDDLIAGASGAVTGIPDGMGASVIAGVNPVTGLYAGFAGRTTGGLATSTKRMVVTTTSAAALAAGSAIEGYRPGQRTEALFLLTLIAGALMIAAGIAQLGRYTRFVSHSVMIGFLTGVAVNIAVGQVPELFGATAVGSVSLTKFVDVVTNPSHAELASAAVGLSALAILLLLRGTRLEVFSSLIALVVPTAGAIAFGLDDVRRVNDVGLIPGGLPMPQVPDPGLLTLNLLVGALSVAAIVLVQGAGVAESAPNPGGPGVDANQDFVAQGVGNVASGLFKGQPVGGSVGQTAVNLAAGGRTRWSTVFSGLWLVVILVAFAGGVGKVAMPTLSAILIYAACSALRIGEIRTILRTGAASEVAMITTFAATLWFPVAAAVGIGVALSLVLQLNREAMDLSVVELVVDDDGHLRERRAPARLTSGEVTTLDVYGSLLYAGSRTLQAKLPEVGGAQRPAVVLRLRGRTTLGATFFKVMADYVGELDAVGGRLYLTGLDPSLVALAERTGRMDVEGPVRLFKRTDVLGESTRRAIADAEAWEVRSAPGDVADDEG